MSLGRHARKSVLAAAVATWTVLVVLPCHAQLAPLSYDQGATGLGLTLRRLPQAARVLYVTAHPDDEHNGVLVALARGRGLRVGLLTLTRGDGGQNAIGPELFDALGVLRTEELQSLHRYDGVEQYFSRAYEFGFSFNVDETLAKWGHEETLGDVVRVVRLFRPDVILTLPLESKGEHAHHLTSARLAREAFRAAADPTRFPDQIVAGLRPWQARKIYQGGVGGGAAAVEAAVRLATGSYDPLLGMSSQELGSVERSQHKSQSAGQLKADPNQGEAVFALVDAEPPITGAESDLLDGIDPSLRGLARFIPAGTERDEWQTALASAEAQVRDVLAHFDEQRLESVLPALRVVVTHLRQLAERAQHATGWSVAARAELAERIAFQEQLGVEAMRRAHALTLLATPSDDLVVPGQKFNLRIAAFNAGREPIAVEGVDLQLPAGWKSEPHANAPNTLAPGGTLRLDYDVEVAADARPSQPYWHKPPQRDRYDIDDPASESRPWSEPLVVAVLRYRSGDLPLAVSAPARTRYEGRWVGGEKQKDLAVVPALSVRLSPGVAVLRVGTPGASVEFRATVVNNTSGPLDAQLRLELPAGWTSVPRDAVAHLSATGEESVTRFLVRATPALTTGTYDVRVVATSAGREYGEGEQVVAYDHIQERRLYRRAAARVLALNVAVRPGVSVGFVPGVGDELPDALRQLGVKTTILTAEELAFGALERYSTIVLGVRAYTDAKVRAQQARLMRFAAGGGHLVLQYARTEFNASATGAAARSAIGDAARGDAPRDSPFAPYPASVTTRRITEERAPLRVLAPRHPLLASPNTIGATDWDGWVQERAIQLLDARDPRYVELLSSEDPFPENAGEKRGLLVDAPVGKGSWTYVGLVLFRQLPAGTPGAYRLLANLISRPRTP